MADGRITIDTEIDQSGAKKGVGKLEKNLQSASKKAKAVGANMTKYLTVPLMALGGASIAAANEMDKAYANIQAGTGATGDALESLKDDFREVFTEVPQSADEVSNALATINTLTGATDETLQELTKSVLDASRMLGEDGTANAEAFGQALAQWNVPAEEGKDTLDALFVATQDYGIGLNELNGHLTNYGSVLQNAGFSMEESADLFGRLDAQGLKISRLMPGLNKAFRDWASEGKDSRKELEKTIKQMKNAESETEALAIATEIFGAEGAQRMTTAVRNGAFALDDLGDALEDSQGVIDETGEETLTLSERFAQMKNETMVALEPLGEILIDIAEQILPPLIEGVTRLAEWFRNLPGPIQIIVVVLGALVALLGPLLQFIGMLIPMIRTLSTTFLMWGGTILGIVAVIAVVAVLIYQYWDEIKAFTIAVWEAIVDFFKKTWAWIKNTTQTVWTAIKDFFSSLWDSIKSLFFGSVEAVKSAVSSAWNWLKSITSSVWNGIKSTLSSIWNGLKDTVGNTFGAIKDTISDIWNSVKDTTDDIWNGIVDSIKGAINGIIDAINGMLNALSDISISLPTVPDWVPGMGGKGGGSISFPDIPNIPRLDVGTNFVAQDGLALLHEGEAVVPKEYNPALGNGTGVTVENMTVRDDYDIELIARELNNLTKRRGRAQGVRR